MAHKTTLKELSKVLNVSISTVSKALNNSPEISQHTIERVKEIATLNQYIPNIQARNLKSRKTETIGVILPSLSKSLYTNILEGIESRARFYGYHIIICNTDNSIRNEAEQIRTLLRGHVDGFIIFPTKFTQHTRKIDHLNRIINFKFPLVLLQHINTKINCDQVILQDSLLMEIVIQGLMDKGCKKPGLLSQKHPELNAEFQKILNKKMLTGVVVKQETTEIPLKELKNLAISNEIDGLICDDYSTLKIIKNYIKQSGNQFLKNLHLDYYDSTPHFQNPMRNGRLQGQFALETLIKKITI